MERRDFLGILAAWLGQRTIPAWATDPAPAAAPAPTGPPLALASPELGAAVETQIPEDISSFGAFRIYYTAPHKDPELSNLVVLRSDSRAVEKIVAMKLTKRHAVVVSPSQELVFVPEFEGKRAALVSRIGGELLAEIAPSRKEHYFSGHACFSADGSRLYVPEFPENARSGRGLVVERRVPDLAVERSLDTGRYSPHNLILGRSGRELLVGHYGRSRRDNEPPSDGAAALIDTGSWKLLSTSLTENPYLALCHLERDDLDNVFISTRSWAGSMHLMTPILFGSMRGDHWASRLPEELKDRFRFNFSLRASARHRVLAVAHLEGKMLSFWHTRGKKLLGELDLGGETPLGLELTPDERYFVVNTTAGGLMLVDVRTRRLVKRIGVIGIGFCPHIAVRPVTA